MVREIYQAFLIISVAGFLLAGIYKFLPVKLRKNCFIKTLLIKMSSSNAHTKCSFNKGAAEEFATVLKRRK